MIISSWNVNSVRARIDNIKKYLQYYSPDILLMQEIKTEEIYFPTDVFKKLKYESYIFGQKSYNGVAIISKKKIENIKTNLIKDKFKQSRIITGEIELNKKKIKLINVYIPNGNPIGVWSDGLLIDLGFLLIFIDLMLFSNEFETKKWSILIP